MSIYIVVGKVGPIRKIAFVPRNTKEFVIYLLWHGEIIMAGPAPGCGLNI